MKYKTEYLKCKAHFLRWSCIILACLIHATCLSSSLPVDVLVCQSGDMGTLSEEEMMTHLTLSPLFFALKDSGALKEIIRDDSLEADPKKRRDWNRQALNHLVIMGTPESSAIAKRTMGFTFGINESNQEAYRLGFGRFKGDVGCVETTFNPYLYSKKFDDNSFSTLLIRISGTTPRGVQLALEAFQNGMNNGIVAGANAKRVEKSILDFEACDEPPLLLERIYFSEEGRFYNAGWSQCPGNEYRACMDLGATHEPRKMWRIKFLTKASLQGVSGKNWLESPILMAYGNAVTVIEFEDAYDAQAMFEGVGKRIKKKPTEINGFTVHSVPMPTDEVFKKSYGRVVYWRCKNTVLASSLPDDVNKELFKDFRGE